MDDNRRHAFSRAFIAQARSDFRVYRHLAEEPGFEVCHALHYLQTATEKLAKAYRLRDTKSPVDELVAKHTGFAKFIGPFFTATLRDEYRGRDAQLGGIIARSRRIAREIEKLAPAIDRSIAPQKCRIPLGT